MIADFKQFIEQKLKISIANKILLAVSGGADSAAMLHLFSICGYNCGIAHCNFHLRGKDSNQDEEFVKNLAAKYLFPYYKIDFDTEQFAAENGISIEMAARELRYEWFEKIREKNDYQFIATAHHQDDLIETFFINLTRGTGIRGLCGIKAKSGKIVRPMLFTDRVTILKYMDAEKLTYRNDKSNSDVKIIRNKFRHNIIPLFNEINPAARNNILNTIQNLLDAEILMNQEIKKAGINIIERRGEVVHLNIRKLQELYPIHPYLFEFLQPYGFNNSQIIDIEQALNAESGRMYFSKSYQLVKDRDSLIVSPIAENIVSKIEISENDEQVKLPFEKKLEIFKAIKNSEYIIQKCPEVASVDFEKLKFPLHIRKWEPGDYFYPFGMNQKKKISDFLIDEKISLPEKENTLILLSENQIVWIIGMRIDNRYKITDKTLKILNLKLVKN